MNRYQLFSIRKGQKFKINAAGAKLKGMGLWKDGYPQDLTIMDRFGKSFMCWSEEWGSFHQIVLDPNFIRANYEPL